MSILDPNFFGGGKEPKKEKPIVKVTNIAVQLPEQTIETRPEAKW